MQNISEKKITQEVFDRHQTRLLQWNQQRNRNQSKENKIFYSFFIHIVGLNDSAYRNLAVKEEEKAIKSVDEETNKHKQQNRYQISMHLDNKRVRIFWREIVETAQKFWDLHESLSFFFLFFFLFFYCISDAYTRLHVHTEIS